MQGTPFFLDFFYQNMWFIPGRSWFCKFFLFLFFDNIFENILKPVRFPEKAMETCFEALFSFQKNFKL